MPRHLIDVQVDKTAETDLDVRWLRRVASRALREEQLEHPVEVSILLTTDHMVRQLNCAYRGIDKATDVLSFPLKENRGELKEPAPDIVAAGATWIGDVVVSYAQAVRQAAEYGHSVEREVAFLTVHGLLHLLEYDHETPQQEAAMVEQQEVVLRALGLTRSR